MNYIKIFEQYIQFITASTDGSDTEQVKDRKNNNLYWLDDTHKGTTTNVTDFPVLIYKYTEQIKMQILFENISGNYVPKVILGVGDGTGSSHAKAEIYKGQTGLEINYYKSNTGEKRSLLVDDTGVHSAIAEYKTGANIRNIIVTNQTPDVSMGNVNDVIFKV